MNFANAVALENSNKELIYITNKSLLDRECGITPEIEKRQVLVLKRFSKIVLPLLLMRRMFILYQVIMM